MMVVWEKRGGGAVVSRNLSLTLCTFRLFSYGMLLVVVWDGESLLSARDGSQMSDWTWTGVFEV